MERLMEELMNQGASLVGFGKIQELYKDCNLSETKTFDSEQQYFKIPEYPFGISIAIKIPKEIVSGISKGPTIDYYNTYHEINQKLDELAIFCEKYLIDRGYNAYAQIGKRTKEYGIYNTIMPHKTVAVAAGIGWIGKSALLVTEQFGSAVRLTSILTDAPIKYSEDMIEVPCQNCMICKNACPGGAITGHIWDKNKERDWIFNALACRKTAREIAYKEIEKEITLCGKCIEVCPYTKKYLECEIT